MSLRLIIIRNLAERQLKGKRFPVMVPEAQCLGACLWPYVYDV